MAEELWKATVDQIGKAEFGGKVQSVGGSFDVLLTNETTLTAHQAGT